MPTTIINIQSVLTKAPERAKKPINDAYENITPNNFGRNPGRVRVIQYGLLRAIEEALEQTVQTPDDLNALGTKLKEVNSNLRALLTESDKTIREIQGEVSTLAGVILIIARSNQPQ